MPHIKGVTKEDKVEWNAMKVELTRACKAYDLAMASYDGAAAGAALAYYKELCDLLWGAGTSVGAVLAPANHDGCTMCARGGL